MNESFLVEGPVTPVLISELMTLGNDDRGAGALSVFEGMVRDDEIDGKKVTALEYSAYNEMAEKEAAEIIRTVKSAFSDVRKVIFVHSTGIVKAGEVSLFIMVTAGHRDHAIRACRQTLELIKKNLPVWKKELF
ncbi:MAG: molybdenum cofactor biosynthesis protein MoaE [Bacteroidales bacterium]